MLVDHAEAQGVGVGRALDGHFAAVDDEAALVGSVVAEQTFHQCRLAGAVFAEETVYGAGGDLEGDAGEGMEAAEVLADVDGLDADGVGSGGFGHGRPRKEVRLSLTAVFMRIACGLPSRVMAGLGEKSCCR